MILFYYLLAISLLYPVFEIFCHLRSVIEDTLVLFLYCRERLGCHSLRNTEKTQELLEVCLPQAERLNSPKPSTQLHPLNVTFTVPLLRLHL